MMKTAVTMLLMLVLFLGGVLFGIQQANQGVNETRGYKDVAEGNVIHTSVEEDGKYNVEVMGQDFEQTDIEKNKQEYEQVHSTHLTQKVAGGLESSVQWFYNQMIEGVYQLTDAFF